LRSDLIDPAIAAHHGRIVKRTGDGSLIEFRSVVDAVRCAIEVQNRMVERNSDVPEDRRIAFRIGLHLGDVVEEADGDLMGDGVNIAARLESICGPGAICLSEDAYRQVKGRLDLADRTDLLQMQDEIVTRLTRAMQIQLVAVDAARVTRTRPGNLDAEDLALRCEAGVYNFPQGPRNTRLRSTSVTGRCILTTATSLR
jgi:adenylate cyclase